MSRPETIGIHDSYKGVPIERQGVADDKTVPYYNKGVPVPKERLVGVRNVETIPASIEKKRKR